MTKTMLLIPLVVILLSCDLFTQPEDDAPLAVEAPLPTLTPVAKPTSVPSTGGESATVPTSIPPTIETVTVTPPDGTLHEFFFDPVTIGSIVGADSTNGVLKPSSFIGSDGASATVERIAYESLSAEVKVEVTTASHPYEVLGDQTLNFIDLDSSVLLSLEVFDATLVTEPMSAGVKRYTLNWLVSSQPWESGDKLMVRVQKVHGPTVARDKPVPSPTPTAARHRPVESPATPVPVTAQDKTTVSPTPTPLAIIPPRSAWAGDSSIGLKIIESDTIVRATMALSSSEIALVSDYTYGGAYRYAPVLKFNLNVSEYLLGTGSSSSVAIWVHGRTYETRDEANDRLATVLAERDSQWDGREAIIFLLSDTNHDFGTEIESLLERDDHFVLKKSDPFYSDDDGYSLHSKTSRLWLPAVAATTSAGDGQEFLLDVPPATKTITLGALKQRIIKVVAERAVGDGSEAYESCLYHKYIDLTNKQNWLEVKGQPYTIWKTDHELVSGSPAGTVLDKRQIHSSYPDSGDRVDRRPANRDAALFTYTNGAVTNLDDDSDGQVDRITYDIMIQLARPLTAGEYSFDFKEFTPFFSRCNYVPSYPWTVTVIPPDDTLHEFFFDPVTVGATIAADSTNGVLKPASVTGANGATSTISGITWEPSGSDGGQIRVEVTASDDDAALGQHILDFIELDGSVSLSLDVFDATLDTVPMSVGTKMYSLTWTVPSQPWESGDELMVRVRKAPPSCRDVEAVPNTLTEPGLVSDCEVLLSVRDVLAGTSTLNWSVDTPIENWDGIDVGGNPLRVTGLRLAGRDLTGVVPPELGELSSLRRLSLIENQLTGPIPGELGNLENLSRLDLRDNLLEGPIPMELGGLSELGELYLSRNQLSGRIPAELGNITWLSELTVAQNRLTGSIPAELGKLADLRYLGLYDNRLTGEIPAELGNLTNLDSLSLSDNRLTGPIPASLGGLSVLRVLNLSGNRLSGPMPPELGNLSSLEALKLHDNWLSDLIPPELGKLVNLHDLLLFENDLSGPIPAELSGLVNLERMWLSENRLSSPIPPELGSLPNLTKLYLEHNQFSGEIPAFLSELSKLQSLDLGGNQFTGEIPAFLSELSNLHALRLHSNQLTGTIPVELGRLSNLRNFKLHGNQLSGEIPSWLAEFSEMEDLSLAANEFTGEIPASFGSFPNLVDLKLYDNDLTGEIPDSLSNLSKLFRLHLSNNRLSGAIPSWLGSLTAMQSLHLDGNQLSGEIPASLSSLRELGRLFLSDNELTGCIPESLQGVEGHDLDYLGLPYCT